MLLATRLGVGIGEAVCAPAATSWIGDLVPGRAARPRHGRLHDGGAGGRDAELGDQRSGGAGVRLARGAGAGGRSRQLVLVPAVLWLQEPERDPSAGRRRRRAYWGCCGSGVLVDRGFGRDRQFRAVQLLYFPAGVSDAVSRHVGGAGGPVDGDRLGRGGDLRARWRRGCWATTCSGAWTPAAGGGGGAGGGAGPVLRRMRMPAGQRGDAVAGWLMLAYGLLQMYYGLVYAAIQDIVPPGCGARHGGILHGDVPGRRRRSARC